MNTIHCDVIRESIPDVVRPHVAPDALRRVEAHAATCEACRAELALVRMLHGSRPEPRPELLIRLQQSLSFDRQAVHRPWWGLTAAAVAALALGIGFSSGSGIDVVAPAFALEVEEGGPWDSEDGLVAGGLVFDELSDDALARLLDDLVADAGGS
ncbi:MAG: zf-HC2 domain-containing protein [Gemmatimonadota bacterium]